MKITYGVRASLCALSCFVPPLLITYCLFCLFVLCVPGEKIPRKLLQVTAKANSIEHVRIVTGVSRNAKDDDWAKRVQTVIQKMQDKCRVQATRRIERTILDRCAMFGLCDEHGAEISDLGQLVAYCCKGRLDPQKFQLIWEVFHGEDELCLHGATTWEMEVLTSLKLEYHDPVIEASSTKTWKDHEGLNCKFGKPTSHRGGCLMAIYSTMKSAVYKRTVNKMFVFRVCKSVPSKYNDLKRRHRRGGFCAALHIFYKGQPLGHHLKNGVETDELNKEELMATYLFYKKEIDVNFEVHEWFNSDIHCKQGDSVANPTVEASGLMPQDSTADAWEGKIEQPSDSDEEGVPMSFLAEDSDEEDQEAFLVGAPTTKTPSKAKAPSKAKTKKKKKIQESAVTMESVTDSVLQEEAKLCNHSFAQLGRDQKKEAGTVGLLLGGRPFGHSFLTIKLLLSADSLFVVVIFQVPNKRAPKLEESPDIIRVTGGRILGVTLLLQVTYTDGSDPDEEADVAGVLQDSPGEVLKLVRENKQFARAALRCYKLKKFTDLGLKPDPELEQLAAEHDEESAAATEVAKEAKKKEKEKKKEEKVWCAFPTAYCFQSDASQSHFVLLPLLRAPRRKRQHWPNRRERRQRERQHLWSLLSLKMTLKIMVASLNLTTLRVMKIAVRRQHS